MAQIINIAADLKTGVAKYRYSQALQNLRLGPYSWMFFEQKYDLHTNNYYQIM